jgi:ATP-dependent DNA helicase RecQ
MGVNKPNIYYTVHFGLPSSMEALYQEGGRAGRDKERFRDLKAQCYVLLSKSDSTDKLLTQIWERETPTSKFNELLSGVRGDLNTNLFMFSIGISETREEFMIIKRLHDTHSAPGEKSVRVRGSQFRINKETAEKAIYRMKQLGIVRDWTIENFSGGGVFEVDYEDFSVSRIGESVLSTIRKHDPEFSWEKVNEGGRYSSYKQILNMPDAEYSELDRYILVLLQWTHEHFFYNRKQSLKNVYEICCKAADGSVSPDALKRDLEAYFKFSGVSHVLQHIAEHPADHDRWFDVFDQEDRTGDHAIIDAREQEALRSTLARFLESYRYSAGLDLISGMLRLLLGDYDNADGRSRLESSLETILRYERGVVETIVTEILRVGKQLTGRGRDDLAQSMYAADNTLLWRLQRELADSYTLGIIVDDANRRVKTVRTILNARLRQAG